MALPAQYAKVAFNFTSPVDTWQNDAWFNIGGTFSGSFDIAAAAGSLDTVFQPLFLAYMHAGNRYVGVDLSVHNGGVVSTISTYPSVAGSLSNSAIPIEVAAIVKLQTAVSGKSGRGRIFIAGFDASMVDAGRLTTSAHTLVINLATQFKTVQTIQGQAWTPCVHSKKLAQLNTTVTAVSELVLGTQRRRRPKR